jgi:ArsR family transcriptional regulator, arsenate/arsenite/antimonite-responsive transcriptional repressor
VTGVEIKFRTIKTKDDYACEQLFRKIKNQLYSWPMRLKQFKLSKGTEIFKAFSEESRIRILNVLYHHKELTISDLEQVLDYTQTKSSRHISFLKNAGIVTSRKNNQWVFYYIKDEIRDFIGQLLRYVEKDSILLKDLETVKILESNRELASFRVQARFM